MKLSIIELFLMCLLALAILQVTKSQNNPQDYLNLHNAARAQVGVGSMTWDDRLAIFAQNYANRMAGSCSLTHSGGPYGENIARSSGDMAAAGAVNMWVKEKGDYNHNANTCNAGKVCGHYTQVVWRNSGRLGCGRARCNNGGTFIICSYDPRGNIVGQRPY